MKIAILLHSTTGNTKVVTRFAASCLEDAGHDVEVYDIVKHKNQVLPIFDDVDLLGVSCPTMYFRPTFAMERILARLAPIQGASRPAFLLATCMGEPGAHFAICAEQLRYKGWIAVDAKWVLAPSNWPTHFHAVEKTEHTTPIGTWLNHLYRPGRPLWGSIWPYSLLPDEGDRRDLERWLEGMLEKVAEEPLDRAPTPQQLHRSFPGAGLSGRIFAREHVEKSIALSIDEATCTRCGTCSLICPLDAIEQVHADAVPRFIAGCTGCWACLNRCPEGAISALGTPLGVRQYSGPPRAMRELFRKRSS